MSYSIKNFKMVLQQCLISTKTRTTANPRPHPTKESRSYWAVSTTVRKKAANVLLPFATTCSYKMAFSSFFSKIQIQNRARLNVCLSYSHHIIIIIINEFHRDTSLAKLQGRCHALLPQHLKLLCSVKEIKPFNRLLPNMHTDRFKIKSRFKY